MPVKPGVESVAIMKLTVGKTLTFPIEKYTRLSGIIQRIQNREGWVLRLGKNEQGLATVTRRY